MNLYVQVLLTLCQDFNNLKRNLEDLILSIRFFSPRVKSRAVYMKDLGI